VHLRSSQISGRRFHELASMLVKLQSETGCWLIINDRVDVAAAVGAKGIQLASHSLRVHEARAVAPDIPVGISVHSVEEAVAAQNEGASWCVAGTVFETPSHEGKEGSKIPFIAELARAVAIPIIAIGGIQPEDVAPLKAAGAYGIATIRGAGWEPPPERHHTDPSPGKTRLVGAAGKITLTVNGAPREIPRDSTLAELLGSLRIDPRLVVVEHNRSILRDRDKYVTQSLASGDVVEIVHFVGGG
jgi:thiazole tautomerase (transcriptional regulator TenI)